MNNEVNELISKFGLKLVIKDGKEGLLPRWKKPTPKQIEKIRSMKEEIIAELKRREAEEEAKKEAEKQAKEQKIKDIKAGKIKIKAEWRDGEYLSGYAVYGEEADLLEEIKVAKYIPGWGRYIKDEVIETLGKEFTYEEAVEYIRPAREAAEAKKAAQERELADAMENELFVFGDEILSSVGNRLLHSLGAKISKKDNRITIYTTTYSKIIPNAVGTYEIREELKVAGFKWDSQEKEWVCDYSEEMAEKTIELLKKYDTKADPHALGLARCWECGRWCKPSELDENGYCGC